MDQTQVIDLSIVPGGVPPIAYIKQNDTGRTIQATIFDESDAMDLSDTAYVMFALRRGDGTQVVVYDSISFSLATATVTIPVTIKMSEIAGRGKAEIAFYSETNICLASAEFILDVEPATASGAPAAQEIDRRYGESPGISNIHRVSGVEVPAEILERVLGSDGGDWEAATLDVNNSDGTSRRVYEFTKRDMATKEDVEGWLSFKRDDLDRLLDRTIKSIDYRDHPRLRVIGRYALRGCTMLHTIRLYSCIVPEDGWSTGSAFQGCAALSKLYILSSNSADISSNLKYTAFAGTAISMGNIFVPPDLVERYKNLDGFSVYRSQIAAYIGEIEQPDAADPDLFTKVLNRSVTDLDRRGVGKLGDYALYNCGKLQTARFSTATELGDYSICQCSVLNNIYAPNVKTIGKSAMSLCFQLTEGYFPNASHIGEHAFEYCTSMTRFISRAKEFGVGAFWHCRALTTFVLLGDEVPTMEYGAGRSDIFADTPIAKLNGIILVKSPTLIEELKLSDSWRKYANIIQPYYGEE